MVCNALIYFVRLQQYFPAHCKLQRRLHCVRAGVAIIGIRTLRTGTLLHGQPRDITGLIVQWLLSTCYESAWNLQCSDDLVTSHIDVRVFDIVLDLYFSHSNSLCA